jgi:hypothetical protein
MLADALPQGPAQTRLSALPIRTPSEASPDAPAVSATPQAPDQREEIPQDPPDLVPLVATPKTGRLVSWVVALRTVHLTQGFLPVPAAARGAAPPRPREAGRWEALRGTWFETGASLWVWLDRDGERLCGPDLADVLMWCEAGQKLRVDWNTDGLVFRLIGEDREVQQEETRLVDLKELAALRGGLGESYRSSLFALLSDAPGGMTFRELVEAIRVRQGHPVHRGTIRALLSAGGFARRDGRWCVRLDNETGARQLRATLAQILIETSTTELLPPPTNDLQHLRRLARAIHMRLQEIIMGQ